MTITDEEKMLVMDSFGKIAPKTEQAAEFFYSRLFELMPDAKPLFEDVDMRVQGQKLMQTLATVVGSLYQLETLIPTMENLGRRHIAYGVTREQYEPLSDALMWSFSQTLGEEFTPQMESAWRSVYKMLADAALKAYGEKGEGE